MQTVGTVRVGPELGELVDPQKRMEHCHPVRTGVWGFRV